MGSSLPPVIGTALLATICAMEREFGVLIYNSQNPLHRIIIDSCLHFVIGCWCWGLFRGLKSDYAVLEIFLCGFFSSAIDVDHVIEARSLHAMDLITLHHRAFLHTVFSIPVACSAVWVTSKVLWHVIDNCSDIAWIKKYETVIFKSPAILCVAWSSHQLRDSTRRGLGFGPLGQTKPLPIWLYTLFICVPPNCARICVSRLSKSEGSVPDVESVGEDG